MKYERPSTIPPVQQPKKSNNFQSFAIIGTCLVVGAVCGLAIVAGLGNDDKKTSHRKKKKSKQTFVQWLIGSDSDSKSKKRKNTIGPFDAAYNRTLKSDFQVKSPFAQPRSTISFD